MATQVAWSQLPAQVAQMPPLWCVTCTLASMGSSQVHDVTNDSVALLHLMPCKGETACLASAVFEFPHGRTFSFGCF